MISEATIEEMEQIACDTRKEFRYYKETGKWTWHNRGEESDWAGPFPTRLDALMDAVEPYLEGEAQ
jgi:hypothetical protein